MAAKLTALQQIEAINAKAAEEIAKLKADAITELKAKRKEAQAVLDGIDEELGALTGKAPAAAATAGKRTRLKPIEEGSEEWKKVAAQILLVMKHHPNGANGKEIAKGLGFTAPNEIKRVQPVIQKTLKRQGQGVSTKFFVK